MSRRAFLSEREPLLVILGPWIPLVMSALNFACGSTSSTTPASTTSADTACSDSAHATCAKMLSCAPNNIQVTYGDEATCEAQVTRACLDAHTAPSTGNTPDKTEACAQAYTNYACADYRNKTNIPAACQQPTGGMAAGAACEYAAPMSHRVLRDRPRERLRQVRGHAQRR
jgi:hypothetical protein